MEQRFEEILSIALQKKSTDIHISISEQKLTLAVRTIDGLLSLPTQQQDEKLFNYLMYQAHLDVTNKLPQTGSFQYFFQNDYYDFRFAVILTNKIKNGVLRILNCHNGLPIERISKDETTRYQLQNMIHKKHGLLIFSGPTGSGKTTTMYSLLKLLKGKTIYSLEDPIEVVQENIIQLEVNERKNFGFSQGIRQILRHNPDVLMIGEIRDENTAQMAIRAALTGCLVVSSLHSFSTISALGRLVELGGNPQDIMDCTIGIFNQRLVKEKGKKKYFCIFDYIDHQGIMDYFEKHNSKDHMDEQIDKAIELGLVEDESY